MKRVLVADKETENDYNPQDQATQQRNQRFKYYNYKYLCADDLCRVEHRLRKIVREEVDQAFLPYGPFISRSLPNQAELSESRKFKLQFEGSLPGRLYTENMVEAEGPSPVKLVLLDALSGHILTNSPLSSSKVEIVVLQGHFKAEHLEDWKQKDFNDNIVTGREGKRPLLVGEQVIALRNGVGFISGICFTDNSSWVRSKEFRLGARVLAKDDQVKEAVSSPFKVKHRRGESNQKHDGTLSLEDEVWRFHGIARNGKLSKKLKEHQIFTVKDFIQQYQTDELLLRNILGLSSKKWEPIVKQANLCLSSNVYINSSDVPSVSISPCPSLPLQNFSVPAASPDQPEIAMSYNHGTEHSHLLNQSIPLNQEPMQAPTVFVGENPLMPEFLAGSYDEGHNYSQGYPKAPSILTGQLYGQDMFPVPTSNWSSIPQPMGEEGNGPFVGSSSNSHIGALPSIPNMGPSTSDIAKAG